MSRYHLVHDIIDDWSFYGPSASKQPKLDKQRDRRKGYRNSPEARQAPGVLGPVPLLPMLQSNMMNNRLAQNKRQYYGNGPGNACTNSSQSAPGEFQTFHGPTVAKQQKIDTQSYRTMPQTAEDCKNRAFQGEHQSADPDTVPGFRSSMRVKPGFLSSCPQQPHMFQPGLLPYPPPLRTVNNWLPASDNGGKSSTEDPKLAMNSLPEVPAQQGISRITAELDALEKEFNLLMCSGNVLAAPHFNSQRYIQEFKKKRRALQNQLKKENERQRVQNLQLSKQLEQQYNLSLGSSQAPSTETTNSDGQEKGGSKEVEESLDALSNECDELTRQLNDVENTIEEFISEECLTKDEQHQLNCLHQKQKLLDRKLCTVGKKRDKLLKQLVGSFRTDAFVILGKLARDVQAWRNFKHSEQNAAQREVCRTGMGWMMEERMDKEMLKKSVELEREEEQVSSSVAHKNHRQEADDVVIISDEDENVQIIDSSNFSNKETHLLSSYEQKHLKMPRSVRVIDTCVAKSGMASIADQSHFILSGLTSILLRRQQDRQQALSQSHTVMEPSASSSAVEEPCAVSQLINQMNCNLRLVSHHKAKLRKNVAREQRRQQMQEQDKTIDLYMKILSEKK